MVTTENWPYAHYKAPNYRALISSGGELDSNDEYRDIYYLTLCNSEFEEIYQERFTELTEAVRAINAKYGPWDLTLLETEGQGSGGGCDTCAK